MTRGQGQQRRPDDYENQEKVRLLFERCLEDSRGNHARLERDRQDIWNLMFYRGGEANHWSVFDTTSGTFVPRPYNDPDIGIPAWIKRCTTNKYARKIDGIVAILNQSIPSKVFVPMTDDDADIATAKVCEDADPVLLDEIGYDALKRRIHQLITLTDKVAVIYWFDNDPKYGTEPIGLMTCVECGEMFTPMEAGGAPPGELEADVDVPPQPEGEPEALACPSCGSDQVVMATDPATGIQMGVDYPRGKICADIWTSYEFGLPSNAKVADAEANPWVLGHARMDVEEACRAWPAFADEIRKRAGMTSQQQAGMTRQYAEQMRQLSSPRAGRAYDASMRSSVTVYRLQHDPIEDEQVAFSKGLRAVMVDDLVVEQDPLPIKDAHGCYRKSILIRQFADVPGTPYGKPPSDDLLPIQQQRNLAETLAFMSLMHHAAPTVYLPAGVTLEDEQGGIPGAEVRYRSLVPGERPFVEGGHGPNEGLYRWIELCDEEMEDISGLNSVLGGARPEGDPTLGEVQILQERGMAAFRTPLDHLIDFERKQSRLILDLARQTAWAPRFRKVEGENGQWNVTQFTAADLTGQVDVSIEPLSAWPKSPSMQMVKLQKAIEMGVLMPQADPEVSTKILSTLGLSEFKPSINLDKQQVARELDRWKAARFPQEIAPPDLTAIEVSFHLFLKKQFLKTEEVEQIKTANPAVYQAMAMHVQMLQMAMAPPPQPDPNAPPPGPDGAAVEGAINAGAIVPAGAVPPPQGPPPLEGAIGAGALVPAAAASAGQPAPPSIDDLIAQGAMTPAPPAPPAP